MQTAPSPRIGAAASRARNGMALCALAAVTAVVIGVVASFKFDSNEMGLVWPALTAIAIFVVFSIALVSVWRVNLLAELGFVYLGIALLYTLVPAAKFLSMRLLIPPGFGGLTFANLDWAPRSLGIHFWRQVLLIAAVAIGYLVARGRRASTPSRERFQLEPAEGKAIWLLAAVVVACIGVMSLMTGDVESYLEHYSRLDSLSWFTRRVFYVLLALKTGLYYILLVWMFGRYRTYRVGLAILLTAICLYEVVYSHGARIVAFTILLAYIGLYNLQVRPIHLRRAAGVVAFLACAFVAVETVRFAADLPLYQAIEMTFTPTRASELEAVYATGYHLYSERATGSLPPPPPLLGIYELVAVVPFLDHTTNHPMYWYARQYFPESPVPPATMGIVAMSAIWGGEWSLLIQGLLNGAFFALIVRWFERRRDRWWALATYAFIYSTCVYPLKYSLLYQVVPVVQDLLPALLCASVLAVWVRSAEAARWHSTSSLLPASARRVD